MFRECGELQHGRRFPLRLKEAVVYKSCVGPAILYGGEAWYLTVRWEFYGGRRSMISAMCVVQLKDRKRLD